MQPQPYTRRPQQVIAFQLTEEALTHLQRLYLDADSPRNGIYVAVPGFEDVTCRCFHQDTTTGYMKRGYYLRFEPSGYCAQVGNWIVREADGRIFTLSDADFQRDYCPMQTPTV